MLDNTRPIVFDKPQLSLVVACYNEGPHLEESLILLKKVLDKIRYSYEIIIVDDASSDDTVSIAEGFARRFSEAAQILKHTENKGRGQTVADGIMLATGDIVGFIDIDFSTSPWYILPLANEIEKGSDVVVGLRLYKFNFQLFHRWMVSKGYMMISHFLLRMNLGDTESGCKFFNRNAILPILPTIKDHRWFWDTEVMVRSHLAGLKIRQYPTVFIRDSSYSRVKIIRDSWRHLVNLIRLSREVRQQKKGRNVSEKINL